MSLNGKIVFEPKYGGLIVTDDGYVITSAGDIEMRTLIYNKRGKIVFETSEYVIHYFSYPEEYYYKY